MTGITLPEVHDVKKMLDTRVLSEKQKPQIQAEQVVKIRSKLGRGRAGIRCKKPQPVVVDITATASKSHKKPTIQNVTKDNTNFPVPKQLITNETETITRKKIQGKNREQPFYQDLIIRPSPRPPDNLRPSHPESESDTKPKIDIEFEENSPHQEGIILEVYQRPNKSFFQEPKDLESLINTCNLVQNFLPKQADIDKILKIIHRKVLRGMHLSVTVKEIQAGYLTSSYFKDIYLYLAQNRLPSSKDAIKKEEMLPEKYILLDSLLFKVMSTPEKEMAILAIPETCADNIISLYHSSLLTGHQGIIKTYLAICDKFFVPNLIHYLISYIKGCHICQLTRNKKLPTRQLQTRMNLNYRPLSRLSMDLKFMPRSDKGHKFILCIMDEVTHYLIMVPIYQSKVEEVGEALIEHDITKYCIPDCIVMDQDNALMSSLINYYLINLI